MRIVSVVLRYFSLVKDSGITEIHASFTEQVQTIIGTNGSGKSSFLRQLTAYPPVRSLFEKDKAGYKSITIEHNGAYYRLETEFEKPSSPHLFFEGESEENLNQGRTTQTQNELIVEHLGITPLVDNLIMNNLMFPKMGAEARKKFLMEINPDQIGFILPLIKQISQQIKACRNNLTRLSERKILLEQQLVHDDDIVTLTNEKELISKELGEFQQNLMDIEIGARTLGQVVPVSIGDLSNVRRLVKRYRYQLATLSHVNRDDRTRQRDKETLMSQIAVCTQQLVEREETIQQYVTDLADLEIRYREIASDGDLQMMDLSIERLEAERDRLQIARPIFEINQEELDRRYQELDTLIERLGKFVNLDVPLLSTKRRRHREQLLEKSQYRQNTWGMKLNDYEGQLETLEKRHSLKPRDIPDSPCAKDACPLYSHFMGEYEHTESKRQQLRFAIEKGQRKIARLNVLVTGLINYFEQSKPYVEQIQWLINYAQSNPILHNILRQIDILSVLSSNPNRIARQLQDDYDRLGQWLKLKVVQADLETAYALKSRQISSESNDTVKLVTTIEQTKKNIANLRLEIQDLYDRKKGLERGLSDIETFGDIKTAVISIQDDHRQMLDNLANGYEKDRLTILRRGIEELRNRHFLRMSEIEKTLRAQSGLKERYQEEVISQLALIEKELADQQQIEKTLIVIPQENMIGFINTLFDQANRFIESVWTVPLKLEKLKLEDPLTYEFQVSGDNQSLRELSKCSEGQTEILSLAINLAIRVVLQHFNMPLCLDEAGRTFDEKHRRNFIGLLKRLLDGNIISQLFYVSHDAMLYESFAAHETMVIRDENIVLPEKYNEHVSII